MAQDLFVGSTLSALWNGLNGSVPLVLDGNGFAQSQDTGGYGMYRTDTENGNFTKVWVPGGVDWSGGRLNLYLRGGASNFGYEMRLVGDATNVTTITLRINNAWTSSGSISVPHGSGIEYSFEIQENTPSAGTNRLIATATNGTESGTFTYDHAAPLTGGFAGVGILGNVIRLDSWADVAAINTTYLIDLDGDNRVQAGQSTIAVNGNDLPVSPTSTVARFGGVVIPLNYNGGSPTVDIPENINLAWSGSHTFELEIDGEVYSLANIPLDAPTGWNAVVLSELPDTASTDSFFEMAQTDSEVSNFVMAVGDVLAYTDTAGMTVDSQTFVAIEPPATVSGTYKIFDVSAGTFTPESTFTWQDDGAGAAPTQAPTITPVGGTTINIDVGDSYSDPAWIASDSSGSVSGVWSGDTVDTSSANTFTRTFSATNAVGTTTQALSIVVSEVVTPPVNQAPQIVLVGDASLTHTLGDSFTDPGATWTDSEDGTGTVYALTPLDVNSATTQSLTYRYTDAGGLSAEVTRSVTVSSSSAGLVELSSNPVPSTINLSPSATYNFSQHFSGAVTTSVISGALPENVTLQNNTLTNTGSSIQSITVGFRFEEA